MKKLFFALFLTACSHSPLTDEEAVALIQKRPEVQILMEEKGGQIGFVYGESLDHPGWVLIRLNALNEAGSLSVNHGEYLVERASGKVEPL